MKLFYVIVTIFLMYYTYSFGRDIWKQGQKVSGIILYFIALLFPALLFVLWVISI